MLPASLAGRAALPSHVGAGEVEERIRWDRALLDCALASRRPLLGVCYGMQLLNLHAGGTLHADLAGAVTGAIDHGGNGRICEHDVVTQRRLLAPRMARRGRTRRFVASPGGGPRRDRLPRRGDRARRRRRGDRARGRSVCFWVSSGIPNRTRRALPSTAGWCAASRSARRDTATGQARARASDRDRRQRHGRARRPPPRARAARHRVGPGAVPADERRARALAHPGRDRIRRPKRAASRAPIWS